MREMRFAGISFPAPYIWAVCYYTVDIKQRCVKAVYGPHLHFLAVSVDIVDKSMRDWSGVRLADGREGWILSKHIEEI